VILSETMIFPYLRGLVFCASLTNEGGWQALDEAYRNPPLSTEQVLHPEKFHTKPDLPTNVDLGRLEPGPGWTEVGRNVVGEMQLGVMLRRNGGKGAAAGWDGDRFAVFEAPDHRLGLVWLSTWDSQTDALEFVRGYAAFQSAKLTTASPPPAGDARSRDASQAPRYVIERRGADVAVVEGFSPDVTKSLLDAAFRAKKVEKVRVPNPKAAQAAAEKKD
jgi:hypothetical protein